MTEIAAIIETCSAWELARLRQMGMPILSRLKGQAVEASTVEAGWVYRKPYASPAKTHGRRRGSGMTVKSNRSEQWGSIREAARLLEVSQQRVKDAIQNKKPCCGRMIWLVPKAAA